MNSKLLKKILKKFIEPISSRPRSILFITIAVFLPALYAEVQFTQLVQRNANDSLMLICEAANESGDDFINARKDHAYLLERYLGHMKQRHLASLLRQLYTDLSPGKQLTTVLESLNKPVEDQEEAQKQIRAAGGSLDNFFRNLNTYSDTQIVRFKPEVLSEELWEEVNSAFKKSNEAVNEYEKVRTPCNSEKACRANRRAIALLYLARFEYKNFDDKELKRFREDIDRTIYYNDILQKTVSAEESKLLSLYSKSEFRRLKIIQAILDDNDMRKAREILITAIEEAFKRERKTGE